MFESRKRLADDLRTILSTLRTMAGGRWSCVLDAKGVLVEDALEDSPAPWALRRFVEDKAASLFAIPAALHSAAAMDDVFASWEDDEFFLLFVNGRVAVLVACPDAEDLRDRSSRLVEVLVDRLLRFNAAWRVDERGRGLFFSRPRVDTIVIGRPSGG